MVIRYLQLVAYSVGYICVDLHMYVCMYVCMYSSTSLSLSSQHFF